MDDKKSKRVIGTVRDYRGKGQSYVAPTKRSALQIGRDAAETYDRTNPHEKKRKGERAEVFIRANDAAHAVSFNKRLSANKENRNAKSRVGKPRGGK